jgi:hypothetical protein
MECSLDHYPSIKYAGIPMGLSIYRLFSFILFSFFFLISQIEASVPSFSMKSKLECASAGDYIVTEQDNNVSILIVRSANTQTLVLEEISLPADQGHKAQPSWKNWVEAKAPGHTCWMLYEIDLQNGELIECFSVSKNGWVALTSSEHFFARLASLPFYKVPDSQKRKIGPPPASGESDNRRIWNPPLMFEGKKIPKPLFDVWQGKWLKDDSQLSECKIELYFSQSQQNFPFPYWIEVYNGHYTFKVRVKDSGQGMRSPFIGPMPHRSPEFIGKAQHTGAGLILTLKTPAYFENFKLFAIDATGKAQPPIPIPFTLTSLNEKGLVQLEIAESSLVHELRTGHRYRWALIPENAPDAYAESEDLFQWR